jgi:hypothetical protein
MQNMENDLVVGIYGDDFALPNLARHKRKFSFKPVHDEFEVLNKLYGIYLAKSEKQIGAAFTIVHPDMVLMEQPPDFNENIIFNVPQEDKEIIIVPPQNHWITIDGVAIFQDIPLKFFRFVFDNCVDMIDRGVNIRKLAKTAWSKTMYDYSPLLIFCQTNLELTLAHNNGTAPFIHYRDGAMPFFHKKFYKSDIVSLVDDPYNTIISYTPTSTAQFLKEVVASYLKKRQLLDKPNSCPQSTDY